MEWMQNLWHLQQQDWIRLHSLALSVIWLQLMQLLIQLAGGSPQRPVRTQQQGEAEPGVEVGLGEGPGREEEAAALEGEGVQR